MTALIRITVQRCQLPEDQRKRGKEQLGWVGVHVHTLHTWFVIQLDLGSMSEATSMLCLWISPSKWTQNYFVVLVFDIQSHLLIIECTKWPAAWDFSAIPLHVTNQATDTMTNVLWQFQQKFPMFLLNSWFAAHLTDLPACLWHFCYINVWCITYNAVITVLYSVPFKCYHSESQILITMTSLCTCNIINANINLHVIYAAETLAWQHIVPTAPLCSTGFSPFFLRFMWQPKECWRHESGNLCSGHASFE